MFNFFLWKQLLLNFLSVPLLPFHLSLLSHIFCITPIWWALQQLSVCHLLSHRVPEACHFSSFEGTLYFSRCYIFYYLPILLVFSLCQSLNDFFFSSRALCTSSFHHHVSLSVPSTQFHATPSAAFRIPSCSGSNLPVLACMFDETFSSYIFCTSSFLSFSNFILLTLSLHLSSSLYSQPQLQ